MKVTEIKSYEYEIKINGHKCTFISNNKYDNKDDFIKSLITEIKIIKPFIESEEIDLYVENKCEDNYKKLFTIPFNPSDEKFNFYTLERGDISDQEYNELLYSIIKDYIE